MNLHEAICRFEGGRSRSWIELTVGDACKCTGAAMGWLGPVRISSGPAENPERHACVGVRGGSWSSPERVRVDGSLERNGEKKKCRKVTEGGVGVQ